MTAVDENWHVQGAPWNSVPLHPTFIHMQTCMSNTAFFGWPHMHSDTLPFHTAAAQAWWIGHWTGWSTIWLPRETYGRRTRAEAGSCRQSRFRAASLPCADSCERLQQPPPLGQIFQMWYCVITVLMPGVPSKFGSTDGPILGEGGGLGEWKISVREGVPFGGGGRDTDAERVTPWGLWLNCRATLAS